MNVWHTKAIDLDPHIAPPPNALSNPLFQVTFQRVQARPCPAERPLPPQQSPSIR